MLTVSNQTKDSLFSFFKEDADLLALSKDPSKTYIAISHGEHFWSTGMWSTARLINENHPEVVFYLVRDDMIANGGEEFLKQFDAVINPGAGDSYPNLEEFTKKDCPFEMKLESHYQNMLELSDNFGIPYLGMCAGAQHFTMYHGGSLMPLKGYSKGQHQINFIEGSLPHFMSLSSQQQIKLLSDCEFPEVTFKGDTAHNYAAKKLGDNMELGAVSEDGIAMSYASINGIRYATQFHPEHYYAISNDNAIHQNYWLDNFIEIAKMHHDHRINHNTHPIEHFAEIKARLDECMLLKPVCDEVNYWEL